MFKIIAGILLAVSMLSISLPASSGMLKLMMLGALSKDEEIRKQKSQEEILINSIQNRIPSLCNRGLDSNLRWSCWRGFDKESISFPVPNKDAEFLSSAFGIRGYKTNIENGKLVFDFHEEHDKYKESLKYMFTFEEIMIFAILHSIALPFAWLLFGGIFKRYGKFRKAKEKYPISNLVWKNEDLKTQFESDLSKFKRFEEWEVITGNYDLIDFIVKDRDVAAQNPDK